MGLLSRLLGTGVSVPFDTYDPAQRVLPEPYESFTGSIPVADPGVPLAEYRRAQIEALWSTQPNVRKVVDFIARNVASIPLHTFERVSDTDRQRLRDHPLASLIARPSAQVSPFRFWHGVISDALLYDRWACLVAPTETGIELVQIPSWRLRLEVDGLRRVRRALYWVGQDAARVRDDEDGWRVLDLDMLLFDHGYAPGAAGMSPLETLADVLAESSEAVAYRRQVWRNGARVPAWIERPKPDAGQTDWSESARDRFVNGFRDAFTGRGPRAGGVPLLQDGMKLHGLDAFTPQDAMDLEGRRLSAIEVAAAYHIAPELVGAQQGNYSNIREFRQMLYRDSLGPYITAWEGVLNTQLVPDLAGSRSLYVEANVEAKLRGSFEEQAQILQSAVGAPWMERREARALMNLPEIDGTKGLVVPLNVLVGGQASPRDSAPKAAEPQAKAVVPVAVKAATHEAYVERAAGVLKAFFSRQASVVRSRLGSKAAGDYWDAERWDQELSDDLYRLAVAVSQQVAGATLERIGFGPDQYDTGRTLAFLRSVSDRVAGSVNAATLAQIEEALTGDDPAAAVANVFTVAESSRADASALTVTTTFAGFATVEAAKQVTGERATKTWVVNSGNPRSSHAAVNGETVPVSEDFSNGMPWPGSTNGDVDQVAGCQCSLDINVPDGG